MCICEYYIRDGLSLDEDLLQKIRHRLSPVIVFGNVVQIINVDIKHKVVAVAGSVLRPGDILNVGVTVRHEGNPLLAHQIRQLHEGLRLASEGAGRVATASDVVEHEGDL